jgi:hypothetical protein
MCRRGVPSDRGVDMPFIVFAAIALTGAAIQIRRQRGRGHLAVDTLFVWSMVVSIGIGSIVGAMFHVFDGPQIAEQIGYTRGNGGFQFENAMGDLAIGIAAVLCVRFRGYFWLATLLVLSIQFFGDAGGHIYYWLAEGNTQPDNIGIPLAFDFIQPILAIILFAMSCRRGGDSRPSPTRAPVAHSAS